MSRSQVQRKPRVVLLGSKKYAVAEYVAEFEKSFDFEIIEAEGREEAIDKLQESLMQHGPIEGLVLRKGASALGGIDAGLLKPLMPGCRIVASASASQAGFDVEWLTSNNVFVCTAPDSEAESVADMAMVLMLSIIRDVARASAAIRTGQWNKPLLPSRDASAMTLGIVGMGRVGRRLATKASAFNMRVRYWTQRRLGIDDEASLTAHYCASLTDLLSQCDVVSVHASPTAQTRGLIGRDEFAAMKDGVLLVNTSSGLVLDEAALVEALESGKVARAGLDVFCNGEHALDYFLHCDRVICTPEIGAETHGAMRRGEKECLDNVRELFKTGKPLASVNDVVVRQEE
ncbi:hypothetical protein CDD81_3475 [Ophiocordyceps australis]|uniref:D-isomer specific 2-hydroxyacid dehydrogenase NAD-binding domain-containing protein n=1 Tax=Ophiocordyceps australis TaxID=1399860 RepID=A0A2C5Y8N2_9HYPO|nr:hypothetical protein CDD81_3475 [Ophiocordyceps australis]